ncbi:MAG: peptidase domain-containing ABC transporter [Acutalibacteraceae bacterium]|nr:peptidase domain-containing ABC transporter [Acutalibacteraceae bacterium]
MKYPHVQQHDEKDCGAACLAMAAEFYGFRLPIARCRELIKVDNMGANMYGLAAGANEIGLEADCLEGSWDELTDSLSKHEFVLPVIARIINGHGYEHYVVVWGISDEGVLVGDPGQNHNGIVSVDMFKNAWQGQIVTLAKTERFKTGDEKKGSFTKFFRYMLSQKKMLVFVIIMSLVISCINIAGSFVFEYVVNQAQTVTIGHVIDEISEHDHAVRLNDSGGDHESAEEHEHEHEAIEIDDDGNGALLDEKLGDMNGKLDKIVRRWFPTLASVCIAVIFMYFMRLVIEILRSFTFSKLMKLVDIPMTLGYYNHLMDLPASFYGTRKTGEFMSRFNDTAKIKEAVSSAVLTVVLDSIMAVVCGGILCWISPKLFALTLVIFACYTVVMLVFRRPLRDVNHVLLEQEAIVTSYVKESIDGAETVKSYNYMDAVKGKTETIYSRLLDFAVKGNILSSVQGSLLSVIKSVGVVLFLWLGAALCISGSISLAELFVFYYMLSYFLDPVERLVELQPTMQTATVAAERLNDILDAKAESRDGSDSVDFSGDIVFSDVDFRYGNRDLVLRNLSLVFEHGKKTAIVGESGSGKTTVSRLLMKFYSPESGDITVNGRSLSELNPIAVRDKVAYISQDTFLFADTVYENLRMGNPNITNEQIAEMCRRCAADVFISKLPMEYETILEENGANLSGGQRQRLAIARALLHGADVLIMDEATSNLDTLSENVIRQVIDSLEGITVIIIAHRLKTIRNCDQIYVLQDGQVAEAGDHDSLIQKNGIYAKNWE